MPRSYVRRDGERVRQDEQRRISVPTPYWVDPYWFINGSEPEKMVMTELVKRGYLFPACASEERSGWVRGPDVGGGLPVSQFRYWMEINGVYFHTKPGQLEADALRYAKIEAAGYKVLVWWDYDILAPNLQDARTYPAPSFIGLIQRRISLSVVRTLNLPFFDGGLQVDHLKGLRKALSGRARTPQYSIRYHARGVRRPK